MTRLVIGMMTGTSIDAIDAALVSIEGERLGLRARLLSHSSHPLGELRDRLRAAAEGRPMSAGAFAQLAFDLGEIHADTASALAAGATIDLVAAHGQTIFHAPPLSWQLLEPAGIARRLGCPVICDFRHADLAAGGEGAPIAPIADFVLFAEPGRRRAILNLGGFASTTFLPPRADGERAMRQALDEVRGCDLCACNQLLDAIARRHLDCEYDSEGTAARSGIARKEIVGALESLLAAQRASRRSLGTADAPAQWLADLPPVSGGDLAASAAEAIAQVIADGLAEHGAREVVCAGGGARNVALLDALRRAIERGAAVSRTVPSATLVTTADLGVPLEAREAMVFAVLGALAADGVSVSLSAVTGAAPDVGPGGVWTFPRSPRTRSAEVGTTPATASAPAVVLGTAATKGG